MTEYAAPDAFTGAAGEDVARMARLLNVSRSGYYEYRKRCRSRMLTPAVQRRADLAVKIMAHHRESDGTYGAPRITADLREAGEKVGHGSGLSSPWPSPVDGRYRDLLGQRRRGIAVVDVQIRTLLPARLRHEG
ncbi:IS3 family transposase [Nocardia jinanensis]|uniref:IS3 family transposase n=1 Tax=Nocardia jinanensis TaxID=382504 RepID=UPI000738D248|nr:IS3 family transposase [Nocardia jinanensis]